MKVIETSWPSRNHYNYCPGTGQVAELTRIIAWLAWKWLCCKMSRSPGIHVTHLIEEEDNPEQPVVYLSWQAL